jgi:hypothetical protein
MNGMQKLAEIGRGKKKWQKFSMVGTGIGDMSGIGGIRNFIRING